MPLARPSHATIILKALGMVYSNLCIHQTSTSPNSTINPTLRHDLQYWRYTRKTGPVPPLHMFAGTKSGRFRYRRTRPRSPTSRISGDSCSRLGYYSSDSEIHDACHAHNAYDVCCLAR